MASITTKELEEALSAKLMTNFGKAADEATEGEMMRASALVLRDMMGDEKRSWRNSRSNLRI